MSITDKILNIMNVKTRLAEIIKYYNVDITDDTKFSEYPDKIDQIQFQYSLDELKFISALVNPSCQAFTFENSNIEYFDASTANIDLDEILQYNNGDMYYNIHMFRYCKKLKEVHLEHSNYIYKGNAFIDFFCGCSSLENFEATNKVKTSNLTSLNGMFNSCVNIKSVKIPYFNVSKIQDLSFMFSGCEKLEYLDIRNWDLSNFTPVSNITGNYFSMFKGCKNLIEIRLDNCNKKTVENIVHILNETRPNSNPIKIYCKKECAEGLTPPSPYDSRWPEMSSSFVYV